MSSVISTGMYFFVCIILIAISAARLRKQSLLKRNGILTKGFIYGKTGRYTYVRFVTDNNKWITAKRYINGVYEKGDTVTIYYSPHHPTDFIINDFQTKLYSFIFLFFSIAFLLYGCGTIYFTKHLIPFHT